MLRSICIVCSTCVVLLLGFLIGCDQQPQGQTKPGDGGSADAAPTPSATDDPLPFKRPTLKPLIPEPSQQAGAGSAIPPKSQAPMNDTSTPTPLASRESVAPRPAPATRPEKPSGPRPAHGPLAFRELPVVMAGGNFSAVAAADFDRDGRAEIVSGRIDGEQGLFLFTLQGSKWRSIQLTDRGEYGGVEIADVTGDGAVDIVAVKTKAQRGTEGAELIEVSRDLTRRDKRFAFEGKACGDIALGDIDGDGDIDAAVATRGAGVKAMLNDGAGRRFKVLALRTNNYEDTGIAMGDVNGDGLLDVIATNHPGKNPRLFLAQAGSPVSFDSGHTDGLALDGRIGYDIRMADFDGDGRADMAIGTTFGINLLWGNGCQGGEAGWWRRTFPPRRSRGANTVQGAHGDVDGDGDIDLAFANEGGVMMLMNDGAGGFARSDAQGLPTRDKWSGCALHDINGDGDLDLVISSLHNGGVRCFKNLAVNP